MPKIQRLAGRWAVMDWEMCAAISRTRPFTVALLGAAGCVTFAAATAREAEAFAVDELSKDVELFGAVVTHDGDTRPVSRIVPF